MACAGRTLSGQDYECWLVLLGAEHVLLALKRRTRAIVIPKAPESLVKQMRCEAIMAGIPYREYVIAILRGRKHNASTKG